MRIALVQYSSNFGGSTISCEMLADAILAEGWDLDVVFGFDGPFVSRMAKERCGTRVCVHRNWLRSPGLIRFLCNLQNERCAAKKISEQFREINPDVVYVNSLVSYAAVLAANQLKIPVIWHLRELFSDAKGEMHWPSLAIWSKAWIRWMIRRMASAVVVNSQAVLRNVLGSETLANVTVIPNSVPNAYFESSQPVIDVRKRLGLSTSAHIIGLPGTLRPVKNQATFLHAIPEVLSVYPDCQFAITGVVDSDYGRHLVELARQSLYSERIIFTGAVEDMRLFYRACDICCITSESESFGRTAVEAFASRVPLISTSVGGLSHIVRHEYNSISIEPGNTRQLADSIVRLLGNRPFALRLVNNAFNDARTHYSQDACSKAITSLIRDVCRDSSTPRKSLL